MLGLVVLFLLFAVGQTTSALSSIQDHKNLSKIGFNESCTEISDCIRGLFCLKKLCLCPPPNKIWNGTRCQPQSSKGGLCIDNLDCIQDLECSGYTCKCPNEMIWNGSICKIKLDYDDLCDKDSDCKSGLKCDSVCSCPEGKIWTGYDCKKEVQYKEHCDANSICKSYLTCMKNICECPTKQVWNGYTCKSDYNGNCNYSLDCNYLLSCIHNRCQCYSSLAIYVGKSCNEGITYSIIFLSCFSLIAISFGVFVYRRRKNRRQSPALLNMTHSTAYPS